MKVFQHTVGILLGLCALSHFHVQNVNAYSMEETCTQLWNGYIGDPTNCQGFGLCENGKLKGKNVCSSGQMYDMEQGTCLPSNQVKCRTTLQDVCWNAGSSPGFYGDPNNCNRYGYCSNGNIQWAVNCPADQVFYPDSPQCVYNNQYDCPANSICRLVPNTKWVGDPAICGNFLLCIQGTGVSKKCSGNNNYDPQLGGCSNAKRCPGDGNSSDGPTGTPNAAVCSKYTVTGGATQYFSDNQTCYGFYQCTSTSGPGTWGTCPFATHFDPVSSTCGTPYNIKCKFNRCGNLNLQFVNALGTNCRQYDSCSNGRTIAANTPCTNPSYPYFNEQIGSCVPQNPGFAVCKT